MTHRGLLEAADILAWLSDRLRKADHHIHHGADGLGQAGRTRVTRKGAPLKRARASSAGQPRGQAPGPGSSPPPPRDPPPEPLSAETAGLPSAWRVRFQLALEFSEDGFLFLPVPPGSLSHRVISSVFPLVPPLLSWPRVLWQVVVIAIVAPGKYLSQLAFGYLCSY